MVVSVPVFPLSAPQELPRLWTSAYGWIPIAGGFIAFALAFVAGANDLPTSFAAAVGSGTLSLRQSVILASLMELAGAMLLGNRRIDGLQSSILRETPDVDLMMWGFMIAMIAAAISLTLAAYIEMPVTSSLSINGAVIGIALTTEGIHSIYWSKHDTSSALHLGGVTAILLSWCLPPLVAALAAVTFFGFIKFLLLRSHEAERNILHIQPFFYGVTVLVVVFFVIYRGAPGTSLHDMATWKAALIAGSLAVLAASLAFLILVPLARKRLGCFDMGANQKTDVTASASQDTGNEGSSSIEQAEVTPEDLIRQFNELRVLDTVYEGNEEEAGDQSPEVAVKCSPSCGPTTLPLKQFIAGTPNRFPFRRLRHSKKLTAQQKILKFLKKCRALTFDRKIEYDRGTFVHHLLAEKFNEKIEAVFRFLLILVAAATALAHGSNDVPTIMGPFADILNIFKNHSALSKENSTQIWDMDVWVRALGAIGVSVGYAVWGWRLVRCLGGRITFLSPSRAFSAQICTLATVVAVSKIGIPVSTTHIFIGALLGVSIADNLKNINWQLVCVLIMMWGLMLVFTTGTAVALYAFTIFSPSVPVRE